MPFTQNLLLALVSAVMLGHVFAAWYAARNTGLPRREAASMTLRAGAVLAALLALSAAASLSGLLNNFEAAPPYLMRLILPYTVFTVMIAAVSPYGRRLALGLPIAVLVGFQAFRIPVELLLHEFYREGLAPVQITYLGRNFDILTGLTAIPVAWLAARGQASRGLLLAWNGLGLALLINIAGVAITSMPGPLRLFTNEPSTQFLASFPYIFVPTVFVTAALLAHVLLFRRLRLEAQPAHSL